MSRTVKRSAFPVSTLKKLAAKMINDKYFESKKQLKDEIIDDYNKNEGKAVLDKIAAVGFDAKKMKSQKFLSRKLEDAKKALTVSPLEESSVMKVCKSLSINYQEELEKRGTCADVAGSLLSLVASRNVDVSASLKELSAKKAEFTELNRQYLVDRKPILKKWREDYRQLVVKGKEFVAKDQQLVELRQLLKSQKGDERKVTRVKISDLESELEAEVSRRMTDVSEISATLGVDPLIAQRLSFIFSRRRDIDELSSKEVRIAKLGEVLSMLAEKLTHSLFDNIATGLSTQHPFNLEVTLAELKGGDKLANPAIVLSYCSQTKSKIDSGVAIELHDEAKQLSCSIKNIAADRVKRIKWDKLARDALCEIVYDTVIVLSTMFKGSIVGKAKTISESGIKQVIHNYLISHQVEATLFDRDLEQIFAKQRKVKAVA